MLEGVGSDDHATGLCVNRLISCTDQASRVLDTNMERLQIDPEDAAALKGIPLYYCQVEGYCKLRLPGSRKVWGLHRWLVQPAANMQVDHINRDKMDNRRCNLRTCTASQNLMNTRKKCGNVTWNKVQQKWVARVQANGKRHHGGSWKRKDCAEAMAFMMMLDLHGDFANFDR